MLQDSSNFTWGRLPYDTTVQICNVGFAQGLRVTTDTVYEYVGATDNTDEFIVLKNTGGGPLVINSLNSLNDPDDGDFVPLPPTLPYTITPGDSLVVPVTFTPLGTDTTGDRWFSARYTVVNSTGTPQTVTLVGRGFVIRVLSHIANGLFGPDEITIPGQSYIVPVQFNSWDDSLGTMFPAKKADIRAVAMELQWYNRSIVQLVKTFNVSTAGGAVANPAGSVGTLSQGGIVAENTVEDIARTVGLQGYYELECSGMMQNINGAIATPLVNLQFTGILGLDTTNLVYILKGFTDAKGALAPYVVQTPTPGIIQVDSICGINVTEVSYSGGPAAMAQNSPNPFQQATDINVTMPAAGNAKLIVLNDLGQVVATVMDQALPRGTFNVHFDGSNFPSGLYYYRLETATGTVQKQMMIVR